MVMFHDALAKGMKKGGIKAVMAPAQVRAKLKLGVENAGCFEGGCLATAAGMLGTKRLATAQIKSLGKNYTIEVRLYQDGKVWGKASGRCDICTIVEAVKATTRVAMDVGTAGEEPPPISGTPRHTPKPTPRPAPGPTPTPTPTPTPAPTPTPTPEPTPSPTPTQTAGAMPLWPGLVLAGAGLVGIAAGAPLVAVDGNFSQCSGPPEPNNAHCAKVLETATGGWILTGLGIASLAASGVLLYLHFTGKPKEQPRAAGLDHFGVSPMPEGGVVFGASGRF